MKLIEHFISCLFLLGFSEAARWEDGDTVIIDAFSPDYVPPRFRRELQEEENGNLDEDTIIIKSQRCLTPRGKTGQCVSLRECYPVLFPADPTVELPGDNTLSNNLTDLLIAASGFCGGGEYRSDSPSLFAQVVRAEVLVCCTPQSKIPTPLPPPQENVTVHDGMSQEERNSCGMIRIDTKTIPQNPMSAVEGEVEGKNITTGERIVNGREAIKGEFPWIVALMSSSRQFCGGSMIDSQTVLTAAHCIQHMTTSDVQKLTIQIGDHDLATTSEGQHEVRTASRILYHRGFSMKHLHHDVALISLSQPVTFGTYIQPVCLHPGKPGYDKVLSDVAGWGQLYDNGPQPTKLQTAEVRVLTHNDCVQRYSDNNQVTIGKGMVCAGGDGKDSCRGDSGGPLTIGSKTRAQIVGIVSWGIGCGSYPGVYTRVDQYLPWINKNRKRSFAE